MVSELVNWDQYHAKGGASFAYKLENEKAWIPDLQGSNSRPEENFEWSSDEEDCDRDFLGRENRERVGKERRRESIMATGQKATTSKR